MPVDLTSTGCKRIRFDLAGIELVGEWVVVIDNVDILAVDCLYFVNFLHPLTLHILVTVPDSIEFTF